MLATLVIGLREGLEAALIVGIVAAFLRRTNNSLRPMWFGVAAAVVVSIAVGVVLEVIAVDLPQAQQEGLETVIGLIAVTFVTGMIAWMNRHARSMRRDLEASAELALTEGTAWALVGMAFLAVLKEGFETSVFLLAAFQSSASSLAAGVGALIGITVSVGIGIGIFTGGVKIDLGKFFRVTGVFLVFVSAGLVMSALRTAHEAGWVLFGQQATVNLSWLAPNGSVQAALLTGVLGIPSDPRLIEVLAWAAYLVPVLLYLLWPVSRRPAPAGVPQVHAVVAASLAVGAVVIALAVTVPPPFAPGPATLVGADGAARGSARLKTTAATTSLRVTLDGETTFSTVGAASTSAVVDHDGTPAREWTESTASSVADRPTSITLGQLVTLAGGRLPIGVNAAEDLGPFTASWSAKTVTSVWLTGTGASATLLDATRHSGSAVTLSGGGLVSARTLSVASTGDGPSWSVDPGYRDRVVQQGAAAASAAAEALAWKTWVPIALALAAIMLAVTALVGRRRHRIGDAAPLPSARAAVPASV